MVLSAFGYASLRSDRLEDWADYGAKFLGLQLVERTPSALSFRMDERKQRIFVQSGDRHVFGFEVDSGAALDALGARLEAVKVLVERLPAADLALRTVRDAIRFEDPAGNPLEAFYGAEVASTPFTPGRPISGFRTGALGMGHVVLHVERAQDLLWFYQDVLGFALSDYILKPFKAYFFHLNARHHSLG
jgi:catechol-2,3-dioxygenase